jgi:hypothetical protein
MARDDDGDGEVQEEKEEEKQGDDENILNIEDDYSSYSMKIYFLGFHPYKEVIFLGLSYIGVAYHLKRSKIHYLGNMRPNDYDGPTNGMSEAFPYTPCMIGKLQKHASMTHLNG